MDLENDLELEEDLELDEPEEDFPLDDDFDFDELPEGEDPDPELELIRLSVLREALNEI